MTWRAFLAVFRRALVARRLAFVAAALLGLMPLVAPSMPGTAAHSPEAVRQGALLLVVAAVLFLGPLALGASLLSRDLVEGRLGFDLARPVPAPALWLGRLAAAVALLGTAFLLVTLPSILVEPELLLALAGGEAPSLPLLAYPEVLAITLPGQFAGPEVPGSVFLGVAALLFLNLLLATHVASTLLRLRSAWLVVDVVACALVAALILGVRELLLAHQAYGPLTLVEIFLLLGFAAVLGVAGWLQLRLGRSEAGRSRRVLATAVWPGLLAVAGLAAAWSGWAVHPSLDAIETITALEVAPDGRHALVAADLRARGGSGALFSVDLETRDLESDAVVLGSKVVLETARFSAQGEQLFFMRCRRLVPSRCEVMTRDLGAGTAPRPLGIAPEERPWPRIDVTASGDRLAVARWSGVEVYAAEDGRLLSTLGQRSLVDARFLDPERLLLAINLEGRTRLATWDLAERRARPLLELPGDWYSGGQTLDLERRLLFYTTTLPKTQSLVDLESGALIADLRPILEPHGLLSRALWLADGRLLLATVSEAQTGLRGLDVTFLVVDPKAPDAPPLTLAWPSSLGFRLGAEVEPGRLYVARRDPRPPPPPAGLEARGVRPLEGWSTWLLAVPPEDSSADPSLRPLGGGLRPTASPAVFEAAHGALVRWDPLGDGALEVLLEQGPASGGS